MSQPSLIKMPDNSQIVRGEDLGNAVDASHLSWQFEASTTSEVVGKVTSREIGALRVSWISLSAGPNGWKGKRTASDIRSIPEPYLNFVMPIRGTIALSCPTRSFVVSEKELAIWDSSQVLSFEISDSSFEQISVLVPQRMLRVSKGVCASLHGSHLDKKNLLSELAVQHMATLARFLDSEMRPYELFLSTATLSLFDSLIASVYKAPLAQDRMINEIKDYIECYITDENLAPPTIAAAFDISARYLHKLFEADKCTVNQWIMNRRLSRSTTDLLNADISITEVAFKWGFASLSHFSRAFKSHFSETPSVYRQTRLGATQ